MKILKGVKDKRRLVDNEMPSPPGRVTCPSWLPPRAKSEWRRVARVLHEMGVLTQLDRILLATYCEAYSTWRDAIDLIAKEGLTAVSSKGSPCVHPAYRIARETRAQIHRLAAEFGFSPSSRCRIELPSDHSAPLTALEKFRRERD